MCIRTGMPLNPTEKVGQEQVVRFRPHSLTLKFLARAGCIARQFTAVLNKEFLRGENEII